LGAATLQLWQPDINGTMVAEFPIEFVADTQEELDYIRERSRQDFVSPGFQEAVLVSQFTTDLYFEMNHDNLMQLLQIVYSLSPGGTNRTTDSINDPHALQSFDDYLITNEINEILVLESPRETWSHGH
jgi:hypothetical protein